jgi:tetratricopeptide (TPR) repeat protein
VLEPIDSDYLLLWGHYARLVELREKLLGQLTDPGLRAASLGRLGHAYWALGQSERAIEFYEEALAIARETGDRQRESLWLDHLGSAYRDLGQVERAIEFYEQALAIAREIGDRREEGESLSNLGLIYYVLGQIEQAIKLQEEALIIAREIGDRWKENVRLCRLGEAYYFLGQIERAIKFQEEALTIAREIGDRRGEGIRLGDLGVAYRALGQVERAIKLYEESVVIAREIGYRRGEGIRLGELGHAYRTLGYVERAIKLYEEALDIAREVGDRWGESYRLLELGKALLAAREPSEARQHCAEALALDAPATSYQAALALGVVLLHQRDPTAVETFADAAARCRAMLDKTAGLYAPRYALAAALVGSVVCDPRWAEESERAGLLAPALEEYRRALENCAAPGVVHDALRDLEMIRAAGVDGLEPVFELLESV